jgi:hypothetical protein
MNSQSHTPEATEIQLLDALADFLQQDVAGGNAFSQTVVSGNARDRGKR